MARYLVTGVAGFIASRVAEFLLADGHTVVGVDNLDNAYDIRIKHWRVDQIRDHPSFVFHKLDICDRDSLRKLFLSTSDTESCRLPTDNPPFDAVINLAARAGVRQSVENPWVYFETNVIGTLNLLESCRESAVDKFVLASSSGLYGKDNPRPYREDANTDRPFSPYAASKKAAEALCYSYHHLYDIDVTVLRYFTVYGPAGRPNMSLFRFVQWIHEGRPVLVYGDGKQSRDFTYVDDIARGTLAALKPLGYEVINLGSDAPIVLMDAIRLVEDLAGKRASIEYKPRHPADVLTTWANIEKAEQLLGWRPMTRFDEGVRRAVNWYEENREWAKDVVT
ncbi:MAG TPA: GDP-mannose 4,6-dehydratase [Anaerolineae bacterium]|nr:GDP-mannose 4,6-dehydratase [Anaerolineae bacterium]